MQIIQMVIACVAYNCTKRQTDKTLSFHRFPLNNPKLLKLWILAVRRRDWYPTKLSFICSKHFKNEDFVVLKGPNKRSKLKTSAVPSIFDFPEHYKGLGISYISDTSLEAKTRKTTKITKPSTQTVNARENLPNPQQIKKVILHDHNYG